MKIALGADERLPVVDAMKDLLSEKGHQISWTGPEKGETDPWPLVAKHVAKDVASGKAEQGILFCWTGTGVSIAANKVHGVRAALCTDAETARGAKLWNNANVLCLSLRLTTKALAEEILEAWFNTQYIPNAEDDASLKHLTNMDDAYRQERKDG